MRCKRSLACDKYSGCSNGYNGTCGPFDNESSGGVLIIVVVVVVGDDGVDDVVDDCLVAEYVFVKVGTGDSAIDENQNEKLVVC